jgi:hypothetical protein
VCENRQSTIGFGEEKIINIRSHYAHGGCRHRRVLSDLRNPYRVIRVFSSRKDYYGFGCWPTYTKENAIDLTIKTLVKNRDAYFSPVS